MLENIKSQLLAIFAECRHISDQQIIGDPQDVFYEQMETLNRLATLDVDDSQVDALVADNTLQPVIEKIAALKQIHALRLERQRAGAIIDSGDPWETLRGFVYYPNYLQLAEMECRGAELKAGDRVVFLGCGPVPLSLISMVRGHAVTGVGIERDPFNADLSRKVIERLQLGDSINILLGDHFTLPLSRPCNLVMVGADAIPKDEIFKHLARTLPEGMKLSYRIYEKGFRRLFDRDHVGGLPHPLKEYRRIRPEPPVNNTSVFVIKEGHG
ncbi:nicotianamine synthase family protein [Desulfosarcina ovata]|uniref:Methyltransferase n=1 Tax=Desulfosarcina ovata subsp. ovata TaxID=2752305 RepID=A0A5K8AAH5_9BACT|nr:nicotianamine synthase family protein [Desulfosarcina ovata]BBO89506.1 methyltransferase [Desulfosarcina ovata subsp. ovata]